MSYHCSTCSRSTCSKSFSKGDGIRGLEYSEFCSVDCLMISQASEFIPINYYRLGKPAAKLVFARGDGLPISALMNEEKTRVIFKLNTAYDVKRAHSFLDGYFTGREEAIDKITETIKFMK